MSTDFFITYFVTNSGNLLSFWMNNDFLLFVATGNMRNPFTYFFTTCNSNSRICDWIVLLATGKGLKRVQDTMECKKRSRKYEMALLLRHTRYFGKTDTGKWKLKQDRFRTFASYDALFSFLCFLGRRQPGAGAGPGRPLNKR